MPKGKLMTGGRSTMPKGKLMTPRILPKARRAICEQLPEARSFELLPHSLQLTHCFGRTFVTPTLHCVTRKFFKDGYGVTVVP
jgi:hypothetical protein